MKTRTQYALKVPVDETLRVSRRPADRLAEVDADAIQRLVAIANVEGLHGNEICGLIIRYSPDKQFITYNFEFLDYVQRGDH